MKSRALLPLFVSLLLIAAFVIGATIIESSYNLNLVAWMWAQRQLPMLWVVDTFAILALVPVFKSAAAQKHQAGKSEEMAQMQDAHLDQIEQMLHNAVKSEQDNARQAEQISVLQQTVKELSAKLESMKTDAVIRHQALEEEALRIAAQAFSALMDRVEANARQMEAVNLAVQYQRAEIKQLRQGVRILQHKQESTEIARLTPAEIAAIAGEEMSNTEETNTSQINSKERNMEERQEEKETGMNIRDAARAYGTPEPSLPLHLARDIS
jgi:hypothetical protein